MKWAVLSVGLYAVGIAIYLASGRTLLAGNLQWVITSLSYLFAGICIRDSIGERTNYVALGVAVVFVALTSAVSLFGAVFSV